MGNGKDCKHKPYPVDDFGLKVTDAYFHCAHDCGRGFNLEEVVILTKAQHEAREDVKKAARDALKSYRTPDDDAFPDKMIVLQQNLDALDKGDNERGL